MPLLFLNCYDTLNNVSGISSSVLRIVIVTVTIYSITNDFVTKIRISWKVQECEKNVVMTSERV